MSSAEACAEANFTIPDWAERPQVEGSHLDVMKGEKLIQKLMIDEKPCYFFGRNPKMCDFAIDHASCSRVHAALLHHKYLNRCFLVDLDSSHGTFIGKVRLEPRKPEQILPDQTFHFGASSRSYTLREKPKVAGPNAPMLKDSDMVNRLGLPDKEEELETLTEYNTALNRRIVTIPQDAASRKKRRKMIGVTFNDAEDVINPEDVDPNVGRFRNLVQTAIVSNKRQKLSSGLVDVTETTSASQQDSLMKHHHSVREEDSGLSSFCSTLGIRVPNAAPDIDAMAPKPQQFQQVPLSVTVEREINEPKKKKYAKEAWPGRKPSNLLV